MKQGSWSLLGKLSFGHHHSSSVVVDGKLFVIAGHHEKQHIASTEYIDMNGNVTPGPDMPQNIANHCAVTLNTGKVLILGKDEFSKMQ